MSTNFCVRFIRRPGTLAGPRPSFPMPRTKGPCNPVQHEAKVMGAGLQGRDNGPAADCFEYEECPDPMLEPECAGKLKIRTLDISVDPALRCRMNEDSGVHYMKAWELGSVVEGMGGIGVVQESQSPAFAKGDVVSGAFWPWQLYWIADASAVRKESVPEGFPPRILISCLGLIGLTVVVGLEEKGGITRDSTLVVSGAAGACGSLAGQIGKLMGAKRVVGICGSAEKCAVLTSQLGFDAAVNYKGAEFAAELKAACPNGVDSYFDNVGGAVSDTVIALDPSKVIGYRDRYLVLNYPQQFPAALGKLSQWLVKGKLKVKETVREGLESSGPAFVDMMEGANVGKMIVHVSQM